MNPLYARQGSKFITGEHNRSSIAEQIAALNKKGAAHSGGKIKNIKAAFGAAKKKGGGTRRGS